MPYGRIKKEGGGAGLRRDRPGAKIDNMSLGEKRETYS